ncbi:Macrophage metalloelastase [Trichostrongylus colubriformis]|uniref:Macrophage metalloelastase n=1 Tax=Trichostrongylus colubriformis TaxID=6319 RepID=A0AAN8F7K8_TRICO
MCCSLAVVCLLVLLLPPCRPAPLVTENFDEIVSYLHRFGYLNTPTPSLHEFRAGLRLFQEVVGVEPTGELTPETVEATRRKRCSHKDTRKETGRSKRFALSGTSKWDKKHFTGLHELSLKWFVSEYTNDIPKAIIRSTIQKAFQLWAKQANERNLPKVTFHFEEAASQADADINILWAEGAHGDQYEFDGASAKKNILAHTFFPGHSEPLNGDIHFDDAETWETDLTAATNFDRRFFPYVLAHEIGHALGLQHAKKQEAIMYPYYKNTPLDEIKLDLDDKCAINWNYVGTSKFCLFVWLMSEIVPIHNNSDQMASSNHLNNSPKQRIKTAKRILKQTRIPRCLASNDIQWLIEAKLQKFLHFPPVESKTYSEVLCNFLLGLHAYRGSPDYVPSDSLEKEFSGVMKEVSEFGPVSSASVRRMARGAWRRLEHGQPSVLDPTYFDDKFFNKFLPEYLQLQ